MLSHEDRVPATSRDPRYGDRSFDKNEEPSLTLSLCLWHVNSGNGPISGCSAQDDDHPVSLDLDRVGLRLQLLDLDWVGLDPGAVRVEH